MAAAADKCAPGNPRVIVCERGTAFRCNDQLVDPRSLVWLREAGGLVTADVTHALQLPGCRVDAAGDVCAGGHRELIPAIARTAAAVGVDGLFMEIHDDPLASPCDAPTQWPLRHLPELLGELCDIAHASRGREPAADLNLTPIVNQAELVLARSATSREEASSISARRSTTSLPPSLRHQSLCGLRFACARAAT